MTIEDAEQSKARSKKQDETYDTIEIPSTGESLPILLVGRSDQLVSGIEFYEYRRKLWLAGQPITIHAGAAA